MNPQGQEFFKFKSRFTYLMTGALALQSYPSLTVWRSLLDIEIGNQQNLLYKEIFYLHLTHLIPFYSGNCQIQSWLKIIFINSLSFKLYISFFVLQILSIQFNHNISQRQGMQNTPTRVVLPAHTLEFMESESQLVIRIQSLDHSAKGQARFDADTIGELSNGLLEGIQDTIEWIGSIKNQDKNFEINENNLSINFKYIVGQKERTKAIIFPLIIQINDDTTVIKLENKQLKNKVAQLNNKVSKLQNQVVSLRQQLNNQSASLRKEFQNSLSSIDQRLSSFKWEEITQNQNGFGSQYDYKIFVNDQTIFAQAAETQNGFTILKPIKATEQAYKIGWNKNTTQSGHKVKSIERRRKLI